MPYKIKIGEYKPIIEDGKNRHDVEMVELPNAPADGVPTDYTNARWPSYGGWADFTAETGLRSLFNDRNGELIRKEIQSGYADLTDDHKRVIDIAYMYRNDLSDENRYRLEWLKFWVDWALVNCKKPVIVNS